MIRLALLVAAMNALGAFTQAATGFGYAIALKTGNPGAVNSTFLLFFPFLFLTTSYVPKSQLSGWLHAVATWNPVTYLLEGLRSLVTVGWDAGDIGAALVAVAIVGTLSMTMCFAALRGRIRRG
jgi:ABC-2 type transport system permease protein